MSKHVDIDQLERDMGDASSEYVMIHHDELMNLIHRVRSGEQFMRRIDEFEEWYRSVPFHGEGWSA